MQYAVNNSIIEYDPIGEREYGPDTVLLSTSTNLISKKRWDTKGYSIEKLYEYNAYHEFQSQTIHLLKSRWKESGLPLEDEFDVTKYHTIINSWEQHLAAIEQTKLIHTHLFPGGIAALEERISAICERKLVVKNPFDNQSVFHFRVIRPNSRDNNPLHRDVWLPDYKDCVNLYIPIAGSNEFSSLIVIPESHYWSESLIERTKTGAVLNGVRFNVPAVTHIARDYKIERPSPKENELLLFSPYLIHGGAVNLNNNTTRISIEVRLWER